MKYSFADVLVSLTPEKRKADGTMTTFLFRPVSYPVAWLCLNLNISPNTVTYVSALGCLVAAVLVLFPSTICHIIAMILFILFAVLDCADGNMARTLNKKSRYGGWVDAAGGYIAYATELSAMGFSCFYINSSLSPADTFFINTSAFPFSDSMFIFSFSSISS